MNSRDEENETARGAESTGTNVLTFSLGPKKREEVVKDKKKKHIRVGWNSLVEATRDMPEGNKNVLLFVD
ncbi:hypothetical protein J6590_103117 [Homalodisca vitripennis]|nr:hypothetical protein J6590_103117 [Homalodisca vitripennis]